VFQELLASLPPEIHVLVVAALPVVELRGAIPLGIHLGLPPAEAALLALAGNLAPIPLAYFVFLPAVSFLKRTRLFRALVTLYVAGTERRIQRIKRYGFAGLVLFVAVPLPVTGAWSGCLGALLLGYSLGQTMAALSLGTLIAGLIVTTLSVLALG